MKNKLSKQRRWQIKMNKAGLCRICGKEKTIDGYQCMKHLELKRIQNRIAYRRKHGQPLNKPISNRGRPVIY